jgi:predicted methyltransferase MtxX (methanogen marker protein 4)
MATLAPFRKDLTDSFSDSELSISLRARNTINDTTAIILNVITSAVETVVVVVVTVDIMIYNLIFRLYKLIGLIYSFNSLKLLIW